jgi:hypothetical protein
VAGLFPDADNRSGRCARTSDPKPTANIPLGRRLVPAAGFGRQQPDLDQLQQSNKTGHAARAPEAPFQLFRAVEVSLLSSDGVLRVYGDSFAEGVGAFTNFGFPRMIAEYKGWALQNAARGGDMVWDQWSLIKNDTVHTNEVRIVFLGINDQRISGNSPERLQIFHDGLAAMLAYSAIPESAKLRADNPSITYSGAWSPPPYAANARQAYGQGATASFTLSGGAILLETIDQDLAGTEGFFSITIDGVGRGTFSCRTTARATTLNGASFGPRLLIFTVLGKGDHTVELTCLSEGRENAIYFNWASGVSDVPQNWPLAFTGTPPLMTESAYSSYGGSADNTARYDAAVKDVATALGNIGLHVFVADPANVIEPAADTVDGVHPNTIGHAKLAETFLNVMAVQ